MLNNILNKKRKEQPADIMKKPDNTNKAIGDTAEDNLESGAPAPDCSGNTEPVSDEAAADTDAVPGTAETPQQDVSPTGDDSFDPYRSEQLKDIMDYYKDIPYSETETAPAEQTVTKKTPRTFAVRLIRMIKKDSGGNAEAVIGGTDGSIQESGHSLSSRTRNIISYCISGLISVCIIAAAFICTLNMPKDEDMLNSAVDELRAEAGYAELKARNESLNEELTALRSQLEEKKALTDSIADFDNSRASLRAQIEEKKNELDRLNNENSELQQQIGALNTQIEGQSGAILTLSAGQYTVGEDIPVGKFSITGTGTFVSASSDGRSKYNSRLGSSPLEAILESSDRVKLDSTTKFSPIN